ncbi:hypothetical protein [Synechococcus sp. HK01-R]|uniref:hypothetical protein n=1 Tax=Synechococcus sp. HK01-R TaxID=2751171 RepID=UPI00162A1CE1|nr:hypothetical protein [Synechococcus sp. HK01-R]QNG27709.1 hypothetical protein H0O21_03720 [Synechococcus sp. HK01-R]
MADPRPLDAVRLTLMQDVLPIGLALVERVRRGGAAGLVETLTTSADPFQDLRTEGEPGARELRDRLDQVSPGLGNPVMQVSVEVDPVAPEPAADDRAELQRVLTRIDDQLAQLRELMAS